MELTEKLGLKKPGLTDYVKISDLNDNMDILDEEVGSLKEGTTEVVDLETLDKTYKGAINEINQEVKTHKAEFAKLGLGDRPYSASYTNLYIDEISGSDENDGTSELKPVKTVKRLESLIPIFLNNPLTINIIGDLTTPLFISSVFTLNSGTNIRTLTIKSNDEELSLLTGVRIYGCITPIRVENINSPVFQIVSSANVGLINVKGTTSTSGVGVITASWSSVIIKNSELSNNIGYGIISRDLSNVLSDGNSGSNNYGLYSTEGAEIIKVGTQPSGSVSDERVTEGGIIR